MRKISSPILVLVLLISSVAGQPAAARDKAKARVGNAGVTVEYGQPALNGRSLEELMEKLPDDRMWRAGSEQITTFSARAAVELGGKMVPAGKYSVYVYCDENNELSLVLNEVLGQPLVDLWAEAPAEFAQEPWPHFAYSKEIADKEVVRVPMTKTRSAAEHDRFNFAFAEHGDETLLTMSWGDQSWSVPLKPAP